MNLRILFILLLPVTSFAADRTFDRTLTTSSTPSVTVDTGSGNIHLHPGSGSQVHIAARVHASNNHGWFSSNSGDIESRMAQIAGNPPIHQNGSDITIGERHDDNSLYRDISVDYDITLPRASTIDVGSGSGDIAIEDAGASLRAHTGSGNIKAYAIHGTANLDTGSGDIELQETGGGDVRAQTGSGNLHLEGLSAGLDARTGSGDIITAGNPSTDWRLKTGSGNLHLNLGPQAHFTLDATTGSGSIHTGQPIAMQGSLNKRRIHGTVNGGGPTLQAETGSGDIDIR